MNEPTESTSIVYHLFSFFCVFNLRDKKIQEEKSASQSIGINTFDRMKCNHVPLSLKSEIFDVYVCVLLSMREIWHERTL